MTAWDDEYIIRTMRNRSELWMNLGVIADFWNCSREQAAAELLQSAVENFNDVIGEEVVRLPIDCRADAARETEGSEKR